ncbi:MAG TPA: hypothetical protein ENJ65_01195 [Candidatus Tenderia electrophaga]|uniref:Catalase n=1 Tax=Candidatus Tenderia electrophaga TaxID=1748243 RepID=A0A832J357_9GAMM|nr:hypothetical protein [Candidatus Tenderia electrophaga]
MQISGLSPNIAYRTPLQTQTGETTRSDNKTTEEPSKTNTKETDGKQGTQLTQEAKREVQKLQARDREVRSHEAAHKATGGSLIRGGASYSQQRGPDGKLYAIGGEVSIDTGAVSGDPQATLQKANQVSAAALAPAQPSSQDQAVAASAAMMAAEARQAIAVENREKVEPNEPSEDDKTNETDAETAQQADNPASTETRQYQAVANSFDTTTLPKLDLIV